MSLKTETERTTDPQLSEGSKRWTVLAVVAIAAVAMLAIAVFMVTREDGQAPVQSPSQGVVDRAPETSDATVPLVDYPFVRELERRQDAAQSHGATETQVAAATLAGAVQLDYPFLRELQIRQASENAAIALDYPFLRELQRGEADAAAGAGIELDYPFVKELQQEREGVPLDYPFLKERQHRNES